VRGSSNCASRRVVGKVSGIETGTGAPSIAFVTGVDAEMFGQLFLLLGSLRCNSSSVRLHVCDLGMT
jgi:hypothetical protein